MQPPAGWCMLLGGRVLVAGLGASASLAQLMAAQLIGRFEREIGRAHV